MLDPTTAPNMPLEPATHNSQIEDEDDDEDDYEGDGARLLAPTPFLSPNLLSPSDLGASIIPVVGMKIYGSVR